MDELNADVVVVGAGFGGLSAALHLVERGARVVLCEALNYPGGCASTFTRDGGSWESGATMFAGFAEGQWMRDRVERLAVPVPFTLLDPVVTFRAPATDWTLTRDRHAFVEGLANHPDAPPGVRAFFDEVRDTADTLWGLFDAPELLPPLGVRALAGHARRLPRYVPLLESVGRPLLGRVEAHGLGGFAPLRWWLDAACQITVQTTAHQAEAPAAMAAIDYFWRGCAHIDGGIGTLAEAMVHTIRARGGEVLLANRVRGLARRDGVWEVDTRRARIRAPQVVANLLPDDVDALRGEARDDRLVRELARSWGAAMLYLRIDDRGLPPGAWHVQALHDPSRPPVEGNLLLCSVGPPVDGERFATVSTHVPPSVGEAVEHVHDAMRATLAARVPELRVDTEMTASPRTFARFTRRSGGRVGGIPRTAGLHGYRDLWPQERAPGLWLVGDSVFPGQSVLAVSLAGHRVAASIAR